MNRKQRSKPPIKLPAVLAPLIAEPRWLVWKLEPGENGKLTKVPYKGRRPDSPASSTKRGTWCSFDEAMHSYQTHGDVDGIGFSLFKSGYGAIDLDHCRDPKTGVIHDWARNCIESSHGYVEVTPSQAGLRVIGLAAGSRLHRKLGVPNANGVSCELYRGDAERYITITGNEIGKASTLVNIDAEMDTLLAELDDEAKPAKKKRDLDALIRDGCGDDFDGDRSRAVWYVIHQLLKRGDEPEDIVAVILDRNNGISAHIYDQKKPEAYARRQVEQARQAAEADDSELERLAKLSPLDYERERKDAAERLNVRASILDKLVEAKRSGDDDKQGHAINFPEPEPWPEPVDGVALLDAIAQAIARYVVMPNYSHDTAALWVLHCYLIEYFLVSPRMAIASPVKQCGKTTLLDIMTRLVLRPLSTANVSPAAIFRVVEAYRPTLLIDEADTFLRNNDELRGIVNSGHRRGGSVLRTVGDDHEPRSFSTYSACAIALIGKLPETLYDRSVIINLKRRLPSEPIAGFRPDRADELDSLARQCLRWAKDHGQQIADIDPAMPADIYNREADNWRPLLSIAEIAGGDWPVRARKALEFSHQSRDDESRLQILLVDIKKIFDENDEDQLPSSVLVEALHKIEGRPWAEYGKSNKPISQNQLAKALKPLEGIISENIRIPIGDKDKVVKGYKLDRFADAFARYIPSEGVSEALRRYNPTLPGTSGTFQSATADPVVAVRKCEKPLGPSDCSGVALRKRGLSVRTVSIEPDAGKKPVRERRNRRRAAVPARDKKRRGPRR